MITSVYHRRHAYPASFVVLESSDLYRSINNVGFSMPACLPFLLACFVVCLLVLGLIEIIGGCNESAGAF